LCVSCIQATSYKDHDDDDDDVEAELQYCDKFQDYYISFSWSFPTFSRTKIISDNFPGPGDLSYKFTDFTRVCMNPAIGRRLLQCSPKVFIAARAGPASDTTEYEKWLLMVVCVCVV